MPIPHSEILNTLLALLLVSLASLAGMLAFVLGPRLEKAVPYLVSCAVGAMISTAVTHLLPEAAGLLPADRIGYWLLAGFLFSFLIERGLWLLFHDEAEHDCPGGEQHFHHHHKRSFGRSLAVNILIGGAIHSFIDGVAVAAAFAASRGAGIAATIAVLVHEVPHHITDVGVLIYSGIPGKKAVLLNFATTAGCALGGLLVILWGAELQNVATELLPLTAANFIYIATAVLMPELQRERGRRRSLAQFACLLASGALIIYLRHVWGE